MLNTLPQPTEPTRQLAPFFLLALLLHLALLFELRLPPHTRSTPHPLTVFFTTPPAKRPLRRNITPATKQRAPVKLLTAIDTPATKLAQPDTTPAPDTSLNTLLDSAHSIAHDEAKIAEQDYVAQERKKLTTPAAALEHFLRQPYKETRPANCIYKVVTPLGVFCFQSEADFKRDSAGAFGLPTTGP